MTTTRRWSKRGRRARGTKKWRKTTVEIIQHLKMALEVEYVVRGGGNAVRLKSLPPGVRLGNNSNAFIGGVRLWQAAGGPLRVPPRRRGSGA